MIGLLHAATPPSLRTGLLVCTITFAISSEMARTCSRVIEYLISEIIYFSSLVILFSVFIAFAFQRLDFSSIVASVTAAAGLGYIFWRAYLDLKQLGTK
jgi:fructoselysine-6-P-deglycase FrlB-like protein